MLGISRCKRGLLILHTVGHKKVWGTCNKLARLVVSTIKLSLSALFCVFRVRSCHHSLGTRKVGTSSDVWPLRNRNWSCRGFHTQGALTGEMAKDSLFGDLPPPVTAQPILRTSATGPGRGEEARPSVPSILSSSAASKRTVADDDSHGKRVRFKPTTTEATSEQVVEAMAKIASHIGNPGKFSKASKLALQLLQSGSVIPATADPFFSILKAAMTTPSNAIDVSLRRDYQALFVEVHERLESFTTAQQAQIAVWEFWALVGNDFMTDDTYVFSKASGRVRQAIEELPEATEEEKMLEEMERAKDEPVEQAPLEKAVEDVEESDPFGLSAFLPKRSKKEERLKKKLEGEAAAKRAHEEAGRLLRERREALLQCLKLAAEQYRHAWAQTIIDILVRHAFDNRVKFSTLHQSAIEKLWGSVREQQIRRKQGKSTTGKLDVTSFERFQEQYSRETISIRRAVGQGGGRSAETWLG